MPLVQRHSGDGKQTLFPRQRDAVETERVCGLARKAQPARAEARSRDC
jgi:hypothetical protein